MYLLHVLFVCTGNICRSPTAERLAVAMGTAYGIAGLGVSSVGTRAVVGHPMHELAAGVLESLGGCASDFAARQLTPKIAATADLILTMTRAHRDRVLELAPQKLNGTFTLSEAACAASRYNARSVADLAALRPHAARHAEVADIQDPIGQNIEVFAAVASEIADLLPSVLRLCAASSSRADT